MRRLLVVLSITRSTSKSLLRRRRRRGRRMSAILVGVVRCICTGRNRQCERGGDVAGVVELVVFSWLVVVIATTITVAASIVLLPVVEELNAFFLIGFSCLLVLFLSFRTTKTNSAISTDDMRPTSRLLDCTW